MNHSLIRTPSFANIKMKDELREIDGVEINGTLITCQILLLQ